MLAAAQRLRRREDFAATIRNGRRAGRGALVVHYMQSAEATTEPAPRAGFVVSKAVGNAVVRNAVKRRLRHLVRPQLADLPAGSVIVVRALPDAASQRYDTLQIDLNEAIMAVQRPRNRGGRR
ncbi:ribonuclease P protein component [Dactylosporangium sp. AC04546]|uniref:ribonuclease P protein component n=1 Tax=Dactylosporangium sp. AC04546 TaxID=2862460 RepID=UPI001EDD2979|nr:ribonuclease P protein component [Dactylosporangium sp. AC04546]WVK83883.1 ribonuclease P protein component [Dactylosporangium sp. AC04546]